MTTTSISERAQSVVWFFHTHPGASPLCAAQHFNCDLIEIVEAMEEVRKAQKKDPGFDPLRPDD